MRRVTALALYVLYVPASLPAQGPPGFDRYVESTITDEGGKLVMRFTRSPQPVGDLEPWQYDSFLVKWRDRELRADALVTFALTPQRAIDQAKMAPASSSVDFSYDFQDLLLKPVTR